MNSPRLKSIVKLFESCRYSHDLYTVFGDWCDCAAISMSNAVDLANFEKREARYLEIARKYDARTMGDFSKVMGEVVMALEERPQDVLGATFHALELHYKARGQFFRPYPICQLMARMVAGSAEDMRKAIAERGFMIAEEPAVGSGAMIIALAEAILEAGFNYQQLLHVTAVDIDPRAVHMAYIQFSLLHIPATMIVGDSLAMRFREEWHTMAHVMGGWSAKLGRAGEKHRRWGYGSSIRIPPGAAAVAAKSFAPKQEPSATATERNGQLRLF
ncbi:N-6 DNA methylase [Rhizobium laguerreae]|uniref:N-6 DNA methylase n=1 Tax=Rhizobium laguerreae TaxID=1076926 RepID=UPI001C91E84D|nr:class I SAM-dependent methyltransferase [Rhizobium laguerreae]MBY3349089.1 class I SAM-dependent methyltransferase [Rhizobium laguerreae]MBY3356158.1 class I SAM-dependent methyltransferase [Rhizobium laguerreae]MBY3370043.1 class I SAM-dependent methyltransferase [Rhizobium laguerreae]MBY3377232.1 class I SAM-dependent methyltransferase [Rhizobium laguerreae]MBY3390872.1 class I SAM-dependent methyltransferase [Rhizobium laguerreae]